MRIAAWLLFTSVLLAGDPPKDDTGAPLPEGAVARLGSARLRHPSRVTSALFVPGGRILSTDPVSGLHVWDAEGGRELHRWPSEETSRCLDVSPDGAIAAVVVGRTVLRLLRLADGEWVGNLGAPGPILRAVFSPDGATIAVSARAEKSPILLFDSATGAQGRTLEGSDSPASVLEFCKDGGLLWSADHADGTRGTVRMWNVASGEMVRSFQVDAHSNFGFALAPKAGLVAHARAYRQVVLTELESGRVRVELPPFDRACLSMRLSPDGALLLCAFAEHDVGAFDTASGELRYRLDAPADPRVMSFSHDGREVLVLGLEGVLRRYRASDGSEVDPGAGPRSSVSDVSFSPDGARIACVSSEGVLTTWDAKGGPTLLSVSLSQQFPSALDFSPDGNSLAVADANGGVHRWDASTGAAQGGFKTTGGSSILGDVRFFADGKRVFACGAGSTVYVGGLDPGEPCSVYAGAQGFIGTALSLSPDGRSLATVARGWTAETEGQGHLRVLDAQTLTVRFEDDRLSAPPLDVVHFPDGHWVAVATEGGTLEVWDAITGWRALLCRGLAGAVMDLDVSPDGRLLASAGEDGSLRLWEACTGQELRRIDAGRPLNCVDFSPDGTRLVTGGNDGSVLLWETWPSDGEKADTEAAWEALAELDGRAAWEAMRALHAAGAASFAERLSPAPESGEDLAALVRALDDEDPSVREDASRRLAEQRAEAEALLREAAENGASPEVRQRAKDLLEGPPDPLPLPAGDLLRAVRAISVLERLGARGELERLAGGATGARVTRDARAALDRLRAR